MLLITAYPSIDTAVRGMKLGARDYIGKPFSPDELRLVVQRALAEDELRRKHGELTKRLAYGSMIGESPAMQQMRATIDKVAQSDATVLITGESGTGKELVARALHFAGRRASGAFVPVNCGALVGTLLDSELFGHVRGAFTGADTSKRGLFVAADGGTLFLDEIGELPLELQPKLLRALQEGEVKPVGGTAAIRVDARVIAATNRTLDDQIKAGAFREDLFYRLAVITIEVPPLRNRPGDIPLLARHFAEQAALRAERGRLHAHRRRARAPRDAAVARQRARAREHDRARGDPRRRRRARRRRRRRPAPASPRAVVRDVLPAITCRRSTSSSARTSSRCSSCARARRRRPRRCSASTARRCGRSCASTASKATEPADQSKGVARGVVVVALGCGCGRIGFDATTDGATSDTSGGGDGTSGRPQHRRRDAARALVAVSNRTTETSTRDGVRLSWPGGTPTTGGRPQALGVRGTRSRASRTSQRRAC